MKHPLFGDIDFKAIAEGANFKEDSVRLYDETKINDKK